MALINAIENYKKIIEFKLWVRRSDINCLRGHSSNPCFSSPIKSRSVSTRLTIPKEPELELPCTIWPRASSQSSREKTSKQLSTTIWHQVHHTSSSTTVKSAIINLVNGWKQGFHLKNVNMDMVNFNHENITRVVERTLFVLWHSWKSTRRNGRRVWGWGKKVILIFYRQNHASKNYLILDQL